MRHELDRLDLRKNRRISFYALGAAYALLLDSTHEGSNQKYESEPFILTALLKAGE